MDNPELDRTSEGEPVKLKTGQYGKVSLVEGQTIKLREWETLYGATKLTLRHRLIGSIKHKLRTSGLLKDYDLSQLIPHHVEHGQIGTQDLSFLPQDISTQEDRFELAKLFSRIVYLYDDTYRFRSSLEWAVDWPYELGFFLSDFLEVIPPSIAAKITLAASDPVISAEVAKPDAEDEAVRARLQQLLAPVGDAISPGHGFIGTAASKALDVREEETLPHIVEAFPLLPTISREAIFLEMVRIEPGPQGGARKFLDVLSLNWTHPTSNLAAPSYLRKYFPENAEAKIQSLQTDLSKFRVIVIGGSHK